MPLLKKLNFNIIILLSSIFLFFSLLCNLNCYSAAECVPNTQFEQNLQFIQTYIANINNLLSICQVPPVFLSNDQIMELAQNSTSINDLIEVLQDLVTEHVQYNESIKDLKFVVVFCIICSLYFFYPSSYISNLVTWL